MKILSLIENYLKREDRLRTSHYVSDLTVCTKQLYAKWKNIPKSNPVDYAGKIKMECGNIIEKELFYKSLNNAIEQKLIKNYYSQPRIEISIETLKFPIVMKPDAMIILQDDSKILSDCKSGFGRNIVELKNEGKPKENIIIQICMYVEYFNMSCNVPYIARDSGYITEFIFKKINNEFYIENGGMNLKIDFQKEKYFGILKYLEDCLENNISPNREYNVAIKNNEIKEKYIQKGIDYKSDWQCLYCEWKDLCWKSVLEKCDIQKCYYGEIII